MNVLIAAATGYYTELGNPQEADCVIGQSFGAREGEPGYINELLAQYIIDKTDSALPRILQGEIDAALPEQSPATALVIEGQPSTANGEGLTSWGFLLKAQDFMEENHLHRPLLVAQAFHVGRVTLQAKKQRMDGLIVPPDLPREFDPDSTQKWTTNRYQWAKRELRAIPYFKFIAHEL
jgi:hypothetical protein